VIGYCFGGLLAWLSATRLHPAAAVGYYAGRIGNFAAEVPKVPVQLHFGKLDTHIPAEQVEAVHAAHPEVEIHWYEGAGHGFNCDNARQLQSAGGCACAWPRIGVFEEASSLKSRAAVRQATSFSSVPIAQS